MSVTIGRCGLAAMLAVSLTGAGGCYGYVWQPRSASVAGRAAQLWLSDSAAVVLAPVIGPRAEWIVGRVMSDTDATVIVAIDRVHQRGGDEVEWRGERVSISRTLITEVGTRRFSAPRTAFIGGIVGAGLIAAREAFAGRGSGGGGGGIGRSGAPH
jgi:hypothetical protein